MRAVLGLVVVALVTTLGVVGLSDATKYEGETKSDGMTRVVFDVDVKNYHHDLGDAATSLWYACVGAVNWHEVTAPIVIADDDYEATVRPALGEDSRRRFRGCLEDGTVDKVRGDVELMETIDAAP
jgi:hypothetical protein